MTLILQIALGVALVPVIWILAFVLCRAIGTAVSFLWFAWPLTLGWILIAILLFGHLTHTF
jgi:hypothetical protein